LIFNTRNGTLVNPIDNVSSYVNFRKRSLRRRSVGLIDANSIVKSYEFFRG